ncbi:MAG TPA: hypothetical protein VFM74_07435 [Candidatus Limnocylindria bacterium]|nr:hypothetical protein [Candidatus Limnocylindria bacterium]
MSEFAVLRDRDAWATIRGYSYQIDLTIQRWLSLAPDHYLELERGEDIDEISGALAVKGATAEDVARVVEQVKHRARPVTLHSAAAVAAIANAIEHRTENPDLALTFRYTTNAPVGRERGVPRRQRVPGIEIWERLRTGATAVASQEDQASQLAELRQILLQAEKPGDLPHVVWEHYKAFVTSSTDDQLLDLIRAVEWSTGNPDAQAMRAVIEESLLLEQHARDAEEATAQYERLVVYVIRRLSEAGIKRLSREELLRQLALPSLPERDRALLRILETTVQQLAERIGMLERAAVQQEALVETLQATVEELARSRDAVISPQYIERRPDLRVPPVVAHVSRRAKAVQELGGELATHAWVALQGSMGAGKTQLAILATQTHGPCGAWVRLRDLTIEQAADRLDAAMAALAGNPCDVDRGASYGDACERLGRGTLLVLDDLPRLTGADVLSARLIDLALACRDREVRLLTTSPYPLPHRLKAALGESVFVERVSPPLTDEDVGEVLAAYGAPPEMLQPSPVRLLNQLATGHPVLVTALARYVANAGWQLTNDMVTRLFALDFAGAVNNDTLQVLQATVTEPESRDLLYRLTLVREAFTPEDAAALAAAAPDIPRPRKRLATLDGLWVQRDAQQRYVLSPLLHAVGSADLAHDTAKRCHRVLGDRIVKRRQLDPLEILRAIGHFHQAEEFDIAGVLFAQALSVLHHQPASVPDWGVLSWWDTIPLPSGMSLGIQLYIRALQIVVRRDRGLPTAHLVADVDQLVERATETEAWALLAVAAFAGVDAAHASRYLRRALLLFPHARLADGRPFVLPAELHPAQLLWLQIPEIATESDLADWLDTVEQLAPAERARLFADEMADLAALTLADRFWTAESDRPGPEQNWDGTLATLRLLQGRAEHLGIPLLRIAAIRAQIVVLAEHLGDLAGALTVGQATLAEVASDARLAFLVYEVLGRQYLMAGRTVEALAWMRAALAQPIQDFPWLRVAAYLNASAASSGQDPEAALAYARDAVRLAEASLEVIEFDVVKALGELAIASWNAGDRDRMAEALHDAGEKLFVERQDTAPWYALSVAFGVVVSTLAALVTGRKTAATPGSPAADLAAPKPGAFAWLTGALASRYDDAQDAILCAGMVEILATVGRDDQAAAWLDRGYAVAEETGNALARTQLDIAAIPALLAEDRCADALDRALEASGTATALVNFPQRPDDPAPNALDVQAVLGGSSSPLRRRAEAGALDLALPPICCRLACLALESEEHARGVAERAAVRCREIGTSAAAPDLWSATASLLEDIFVRGRPFAELLGMSDALGTQHQILGVVARIGASIQPRAPLPQNCALHVAAVRYLYQIRALVPGAYRRLVLPFVFNYWTDKVATQGFRFRTPRLLQDRLLQARDRRPEEQAQAVLSDVAESLGLQVAVDTWEW